MGSLTTPAAALESGEFSRRFQLARDGQLGEIGLYQADSRISCATTRAVSSP
ncbi:hypothetical protein [Nocardia australiensis]|uniref:hypothetical protein n=1 Tax=Nocardia australiensis TaxID=2887191 RepID=UPI001D156250|nr:hypothetical protein [Nocardia australiensis]